jgi:hypothetical protein
LAFAAGEISKTANTMKTALMTLPECDAEQIFEKNAYQDVHAVSYG